MLFPSIVCRKQDNKSFNLAQAIQSETHGEKKQAIYDLFAAYFTQYRYKTYSERGTRRLDAKLRCVVIYGAACLLPPAPTPAFRAVGPLCGILPSCTQQQQNYHEVDKLCKYC